jgi:hypothetical protein
VTNLPVADFAAAVEKLGWYALRWKIETFHKVMKSGCRAEETRLETSDRLAKFLALIAVVSWRIPRQSGCDERDNQDEIARLDFGMIVAIFGFCNA